MTETRQIVRDTRGINFDPSLNGPTRAIYQGPGLVEVDKDYFGQHGSGQVGESILKCDQLAYARWDNNRNNDILAAETNNKADHYLVSHLKFATPKGIPQPANKQAHWREDLNHDAMGKTFNGMFVTGAIGGQWLGAHPLEVWFNEPGWNKWTPVPQATAGNSADPMDQVEGNGKKNQINIGPEVAMEVLRSSVFNNEPMVRAAHQNYMRHLKEEAAYD